ncbi:1062_t:CDS:2 [Funneliformis geosporum]|nr:1062_t:CDS:2 [Funneliformis geosporum]
MATSDYYSGEDFDLDPTFKLQDQASGTIVINEAYREKMAEFDPSFVVLGEQKIKTMIVKSCKYNQENLRNLLTKTAENVSLTMDLWSSKAKHGYLEVTAIWITPNFEIKDVMLEINYVSSLHSSKVVVNELYKYIKNWNLENHTIIQLQTDLCTSTDRESKKDDSKLKRILLSDEEWDFRTIPIIKERIFDLADEILSNTEEFSNENTDIPSNLDLIAALLDPCYKNLDFLENADEKKQIIQKLHNKLSEVEVSGFEILNNPALSQDIESSIRSHKEYRQQRQKKIKKAVTNVVISDEVTNYLSLLLALETEDPLN